MSVHCFQNVTINHTRQKLTIFNFPQGFGKLKGGSSKYSFTIAENSSYPCTAGAGEIPMNDWKALMLSGLALFWNNPEKRFARWPPWLFSSLSCAISGDVFCHGYWIWNSILENLLFVPVLYLPDIWGDPLDRTVWCLFRQQSIRPCPGVLSTGDWASNQRIHNAHPASRKLKKIICEFGLCNSYRVLMWGWKNKYQNTLTLNVIFSSQDSEKAMFFAENRQLMKTPAERHRSFIKIVSQWTKTTKVKRTFDCQGNEMKAYFESIRKSRQQCSQTRSRRTGGQNKAPGMSFWLWCWSCFAPLSETSQREKYFLHKMSP